MGARSLGAHDRGDETEAERYAGGFAWRSHGHVARRKRAKRVRSVLRAEPWAVVHKATLWVINKERNRAAAPHGRQRTAAAMYSLVQREVERLVSDHGGERKKDKKEGKKKRRHDFAGNGRPPDL